MFGVDIRRRQRSREAIRELVTEYSRSGLSAARFAARRQIPISTLYSYLGQRAGRGRGPSRPKLIPVRVINSPRSDSPAGTIGIELPAAITVRVPIDISSERLAELVAALR